MPAAPDRPSDPTDPRGGTVACGHPDTAAAAIEILEDGGNAFDAVLAGLCAAFFAEPVLASLGGGGFLLAAGPRRAPVLYDFFCETPSAPQPGAQLDFLPIHADFGTTRQEFHIGRASVAVPGVPAGIFAIHRDLCSLPLERIIEPALRLAREGVVMNAFQADVFRIVAPIYRHSSAARAQYRPHDGADRLPDDGERLILRRLGDTLAELAAGGADFFYRGELARRISAYCGAGGLLQADDLARYRVVRRQPLQLQYGGVAVYTNPLPASGGTLICFGLELLQRSTEIGGSHLQRLAQVMDLTGYARSEFGIDDPNGTEARRLLDAASVDRYVSELAGRARAFRGTTHLSVVDAAGHEAALTVSNGEGSGDLVRDTGIMLNNMLGEEDLNPGGFHRWQPATRMTSMMSPTLLHFPDGRRVVLGSGGSNRIRTAILQVIVNRITRGMTLQEAIDAPRMHLENGFLNVEPGLAARELAVLCADWPQHRVWEQQSLFFGGVHAVEHVPGETSGVGDRRRSGVSRRSHSGFDA